MLSPDRTEEKAKASKAKKKFSFLSHDFEGTSLNAEKYRQDKLNEQIKNLNLDDGNDSGLIDYDFYKFSKSKEYDKYKSNNKEKTGISSMFSKIISK